MVVYPLSKQQKLIVSTWLSTKDKPLLISGLPGTGKSTLATHLLKDYHIIQISSEHIKYTGDLISHIKCSLFRKNILMMCSDNHYKSLLIDDFHYFIKQDKTNANKLLEFVKTIHKNHPVIIICDKLTHKLYSIASELSYTIECRYSSSLCKRIFKHDNINTYINKGNNLHSLKTNLYDINSSQDKSYSLNTILEKITYEKNTINDKFILCSSEYTTLSLNLLENLNLILRDFSLIYDIYKSICYYDMIETKYIDRNIDTYLYILYSCIIPNFYIRKARVYKKISFNYNKYISKSLIQIHNQSLLSSFNYIELLELIYKHQLVDNSKKISLLIQHREYDKSILLKQMKVYNYYYNKNITKKYIVKTLKNISKLL